VSASQRPALPSRTLPIVGAVVILLLAFSAAVGGSGPLALAVPIGVTTIALALATGAIRQSRLSRADYEARLTRWAATEAVLAERLRIARDLHDIVSHGLGLITVRAAATRHLARGGPSDAADMREALADIEDAGRQATAELRRMLTVLRTSDDDTGPRLPVETFEQLPEIVANADVAGLRTRLTLRETGPVSPGVQVAVCKTVREALSNAARHAGPTDVRVRIVRDGAAVLVTVDDDGPGGPWRPAPGAGHGLSGLRERVTGLGGSFVAGPDGRGFRVAARIPDEVPG
jgi:signal transduction histidine kinase